VSQLQSTQGVHMNLFNSTQTNYLALNETRKPFQDVHVRRAISLAINRDALVKAVLFGHGKPANSLFPPQVPYYDPNTPGYQFNLAEAKKEMAQSSVPKGFSTTIVIPSGNSDYLTISTIIQSELKPLGIIVKINQLDPNTANAQFQKLDYDMSPTLWTMDISDPDELATFAVDPKSGAKSFFTMYNNPAVVNAAHEAERTLDTEKRQQLYNTLQTGAAKDAFMAFLYYSPYPYATTTNVHGFFVTPLGNMHMENVWLSK
jgi:peptide/nickel transport system substrate-binding protein